jgi:hypothetical protein
MSISLVAVLVIVLSHWVFDFVFQAEEWANNKSKNIGALLSHTITYSGLWVIPMSLLFGFNNPHQEVRDLVNDTMVFVFITFICHTITDFFTSKWVSRKFERKEYGSPIPNTGGFTVIGFDQVLHYFQLFLTYYFLTR